MLFFFALNLFGFYCLFWTPTVPQAGVREREGHHRVRLRPRVHLHFQRPRLHPAHVPRGPQDPKVSVGVLVLPCVMRGRNLFVVFVFHRAPGSLPSSTYRYVHKVSEDRL